MIVKSVVKSVVTDNVFVPHALNQATLAAELLVQILYAVSQACLMRTPLEKRTNIDDLFANIIDHRFMTYIIV